MTILFEETSLTAPVFIFAKNWLACKFGTTASKNYKLAVNPAARAAGKPSQPRQIIAHAWDDLAET
jgi:hypothetical protein